MAFPDGLVLRTVTAGGAVSHTGTPVRIDIVVKPSLRLVHEASGTILSDITETFVVEPGQRWTVQVPAVDQAGILGPDGLPVTFWSYRVEVTETAFEQNPYVQGATVGKFVPRPTVTYTVQPVESDEPFDLDVTSPNGYITTPLGPAWLGPDEADVPAEAGLWIDNSDPIEWVFKNRTVAA